MKDTVQKAKIWKVARKGLFLRKTSSPTQNQITFVVQGPVLHPTKGVGGTKGLIESIRRHYPKSKIVLSTWTGESVEGIDADKIVFSKDPGSFPGVLDGKLIPNNINRQIQSTQAGLQVVQTEYSVKLRSDLVMTRPQALKVLAHRPPRLHASPYVVTREYVAVVDFTSINPKKRSPLVFHPCDWIYGGRTEDLRSIFQIPFMKLEDAVYFEKQSPLIWEKVRGGQLSKYRPEAYIWGSFLASKGVQIPASSYEFSSKWTQLSEDYMIHNLMIVSLSQFGFVSFKYPQALFQSKSWNMLFRFQYVYTYYEWRNLHYTRLNTRAPLLFSLESLLMYVAQRLQATRLGSWLTRRGMGEKLAKVLK
jgi:hypothetical protein